MRSLFLLSDLHSFLVPPSSLRQPELRCLGGHTPSTIFGSSSGSDSFVVALASSCPLSRLSPCVSSYTTTFSFIEEDHHKSAPCLLTLCNSGIPPIPLSYLLIWTISEGQSLLLQVFPTCCGSTSSVLSKASPVVSRSYALPLCTLVVVLYLRPIWPHWLWDPLLTKMLK